VLGLRLPAAEAEAVSVEAAPFIDLLVETRFNLRQAKQYQLADTIRSGWPKLGYCWRIPQRDHLAAKK
jgi:cysteinyl-tRNA synthetase